MKLTAATKIISCLCVHPFERFERALKIVSDEIRLKETLEWLEEALFKYLYRKTNATVDCSICVAPDGTPVETTAVYRIESMKPPGAYWSEMIFRVRAYSRRGLSREGLSKFNRPEVYYAVTKSEVISNTLAARKEKCWQK